MLKKNEHSIPFLEFLLTLFSKWYGTSSDISDMWCHYIHVLRTSICTLKPPILCKDGTRLEHSAKDRKSTMDSSQMYCRENSDITVKYSMGNLVCRLWEQTERKWKRSILRQANPAQGRPMLNFKHRTFVKDYKGLLIILKYALLTSIMEKNSIKASTKTYR